MRVAPGPLREHSQEMFPESNTRYRTIVADPPWGNEALHESGGWVLLLKRHAG